MGAAAQARSNTTVASILPPVAPGGTATCPEGRIRFAIFFDGTNNNAYRDWGPGFKSWTPGSGPSESALPLNQEAEDRDPMNPPNAPTNVAKLYYLFKEKIDLERRVYIIGVGAGTKTSRPGATGIIAKAKAVKEGFEGATGHGARSKIEDAQLMLTEFVNRSQHWLAIEKRVDVFGFSRGAAESREFVNDTIAKGIEDRSNGKTDYKWERDIWGRSKKVDTYPRMGGILFEFMGIFDTVASMGAGAVWEVGNDVAGYDMFVKGRPADKKKTPKEVLDKPLDVKFVHDKEGWVHRTFHCVADDEHRDVFPIELLGRDPKGRGYYLLPRNMREQSYPGAHSDVGGGYRRTPAQAFKADRVVTKSTWYGRDYQETEPGHPAKSAMFGNLAHIPLKDMQAEAELGHVPLHKVNKLPQGLWEINPAGAPGNVSLYKLYSSYLALRKRLLEKHLGNLPKWADYTKDIVHDPVYLQALPESVYQAIVIERNQDPSYQLLSEHFIHKPAEEETWMKIAEIRRKVRIAAAKKAGKLAGVGEEKGFEMFGDARDLNLTDTARQRDVHFMGYQNSYDPDCSTVK